MQEELNFDEHNTVNTIDELAFRDINLTHYVEEAKMTDYARFVHACDYWDKKQLPCNTGVVYFKGGAG